MNLMERIRNYWFIRKGKFQFVEANNFIPVNNFESSKLLIHSLSWHTNSTQKSLNQRMLICVACGNGSFEYKIGHQNKEAQMKREPKETEKEQDTKMEERSINLRTR